MTDKYFADEDGDDDGYYTPEEVDQEIRKVTTPHDGNNNA